MIPTESLPTRSILPEKGQISQDSARRSHSRSQLLNVLWAGTFFLAPMSRLHVATSVTFSDLILVIAAGLTVARAMATGKWVRRGSMPGIPGLLLIVIAGCLASLFAAPSITSSFVGVAKFAVAAFGATLAVLLWNPNRSERVMAMWAFLSGATVSALVGLVGRSNLTDRSHGLAYLPNRFGLMCLMSIGLAIALISISKLAMKRILYVVVLILVAGILDSGSRSATVVIPVVIVAALWLQGRRGRILGVATVLAVGAAVVSLGILPGTFSSVSRLLHPNQSPTVAAFASSNSNSQRAQAAQQGVDYYLNSPLVGAGFTAQLGVQNGAIAASPLEAHDIYLQFLAAGGPLALFGFLYFLWCVWIRVRGSLKCLPKRTAERGLLAGIYAGYLGWLINGLLQNQIWDRSLWLYTGILLASANAIRLNRTQLASVDADSTTRARSTRRAV